MREEEGSAGLGSYTQLLHRRRAWILAILPAAFLIAVYFAFAITPRYRSTATIILEPSSIPQEFIQTTVANYADQQIEIISGRVMSPETLQELVHQYDPYPEATDLSVEQKAHRVMLDMQLERVDPVTLEPLEKSPAFSLYYFNPNPKRAEIVCQRLADLFLTYHQRERTRAAQAATKLITARANDLTEELRKLDAQYAELTSQHADVLPGSKDRNELNRERSERDLEDAQRQLRAAQERQSLMQIQLNGLSPNLLAGKGGAVGGDLTDLATVKAQLADAEQRYTPDHPDVKRLRRALASLMTQQNGRGTGPVIKADNPEYQRVASQLESANRDVAALQATVQREVADLSRYTYALHGSPEIERQFVQLQRQRDSLQAQYLQVQEKIKGAEMGQRFEADKQGEHFSEIRAPYAASSPYFPNRLGMILLGLVAGSVIAAIAVAIAESSDATVRGGNDLAVLGKFTMLGGVPEILRPQDHRRRRLIWSSVCALYLAAAIVVAVTVVRAEVGVQQHVQT
jgi:polysaccharide biosynthesis transport protein